MSKRKKTYKELNAERKAKLRPRTLHLGGTIIKNQKPKVVSVTEKLRNEKGYDAYLKTKKFRV